MGASIRCRACAPKGVAPDTTHDACAAYLVGLLVAGDAADGLDEGVSGVVHSGLDALVQGESEFRRLLRQAIVQLQKWACSIHVRVRPAAIAAGEVTRLHPGVGDWCKA